MLYYSFKDVNMTQLWQSSFNDLYCECVMWKVPCKKGPYGMVYPPKIFRRANIHQKCAILIFSTFKDFLEINCINFVYFWRKNKNCAFLHIGSPYKFRGINHAIRALFAWNLSYGRVILLWWSWIPRILALLLGVTRQQLTSHVMWPTHTSFWITHAQSVELRWPTQHMPRSTNTNRFIIKSPGWKPGRELLVKSQVPIYSAQFCSKYLGGHVNLFHDL